MGGAEGDQVLVGEGEFRERASSEGEIERDVHGEYQVE